MLRDFGKQLSSRFRASDHVGRYGGEEFLVVLRGANTAAAVRIFEELRVAFRTREYGDLPRYTFSVGIAEIGIDGAEGTELLARADVRLYEAKRQGRDRTIGGVS